MSFRILAVCAFTTLGTLAALTLVSPAAQALSCLSPGTPLEEWEQADVVFAGRVAAVSPRSGELGLSGDQGSITFTVEEWFKKNADSDALSDDEVTLALGGYTTWFTTPTEGQVAIVYVRAHDEEELRMPLCGRSVVGLGANDEIARLRTARENRDTEGELCHQYHAGDAVPAGFGLPYSVSTSNLVLKALCDDQRVTLTLDLAAGAYAFQQGFYTQGSGWSSLTYAGVKAGPWRQGQVSTSLDRSKLDPDRPLYYVAYTCDRVRGVWQCGCTDATCESSSWQLQKIELPPEEDAVMCTMDAKQCPDGSWVGREGPNCEFAACPGS